ncbi:VanZ family protein [Cellulomonas sp. zg-ZUI22]|uniref:VanZ family protein n=1 Tax=Cellulomonas sp. zg-ZUI22 TaxID=2816955 RepID=UPI001A93C975|nr:VanZ family protein [Cellulomonas sp. zg-ZUI22]MBO0898560.1 VanZ family protein [Cellulomonas sp. zg-ZUI22]
MRYYLEAFAGRFVVLAVLMAFAVLGVVVLGVRDVRSGGTWSSFLLRVAPRAVFVVLAVATGFATLTPLGTGEGRAVDLVPLRSALAAGVSSTTWAQVAGNLALLSWLGLLLPVVSCRLATVPRTTAVVAATSAAVEAAQYVLGLGRYSTVDDVLLNTLGGAVAAVVGVHLLAPRLRRGRDGRVRAPGGVVAEPS